MTFKKLAACTYLTVLIGVVSPAIADWNSEEANIKAGFENLPKLKGESLKLLDQSRKNNPEHFKMLMGKVDDRIASFLKSDIRPIDTKNVIGAKASNYNYDIWRIVTIANDLFLAGEGYLSPESKYAGKKEVVSKAVDGFEYVCSLMKAVEGKQEGTTGCPDSNLDRFAFGPWWDAFILLGDQLPEDLRNRTMRLLYSAARYQAESFGKRARPWTWEYPNMDAAYMLVQAQGYRLFGDKMFIDDYDKRAEALRECMSGSTWMYLKGWNPAPGYTHVTLNWVGRAHQLCNQPVLLKQIQEHAEYFKYFTEPSGIMDYGMIPFNKHKWQHQPYQGISGEYSMEIVQRYAPTPVLQKIIDDAYDNLEVRQGWHLYWVSAPFGKTEKVPDNFIRQAPEFEGFQVRQSNAFGTLTAYATGRDFAIDTRVSAIASFGKDVAFLGGVFIEILQDGASYYLGEMSPRKKLDVGGAGASLSIIQERRTMGPKSRPMIWGNQAEDFKNWTFNVTKGGSLTGPPVESAEKWVWNKDRLDGEIKFTALQDTKLEGIRITLPTGGSTRLSEKRQLSKGEARRFGNLCVLWQSMDAPMVSSSKDFDFRMDVAAGEYDVVVVSGDPEYATAPFDIMANGKVVLTNITAPKNGAVERRFSVKVAGDEGIALTFHPQSGDHWKIGALSILSKDRKFVKKFDVGVAKVPPMKGYERLSGADIYSKERGYGWDQSLVAQERLRGEVPVNLISDLITSPVSGANWEVKDEGRDWPKGRSLSLRISVGMNDSLDAWLAGGK